MSHLTTIKTNLKNLDYIKRAIKDIGLDCIEYSENNKVSIQAWKETTNVSMEIKTGSKYSIGLVLAENGDYEFVADWWAVEPYIDMSKEQFLEKITQRYAYNSVLDQLKSKGYELLKEEYDEDNNLRIVASIWE